MKIVRKSNTQASKSSNFASEPSYVYSRVSRKTTKIPERQTQGFRRADFSDMTHHELRDWMNGHLRSGHLSLKDSTSLVWLNLNMQPDGEFKIPDAEDDMRINFPEQARRGMEQALSSNNQSLADLFLVAIEIMRKNQGQTIGVDTCV